MVCLAGYVCTHKPEAMRLFGIGSDCIVLLLFFFFFNHRCLFLCIPGGTAFLFFNFTVLFFFSRYSICWDWEKLMIEHESYRGGVWGSVGLGLGLGREW